MKEKLTVDDFKTELEERIIPFWSSIYDCEYGSVYGKVDFNYRVDKLWDKGSILNSRVLWFFSTCLINKIGPKEKLTRMAKGCYTFLRNNYYDKKYGGIYWSVTYCGKLKDSTKHTYNIAFAIYALSAYYEALKDEKALELALELYALIENKCRDDNGYLEAFSADFKPIKNEALSQNGVVAKRTMNTLLHVLEAYTNLFKVTKDNKVKISIINIFNIFEKHIYNRKKKRQEVFFDLEYNSLIDLHSFGHDIESSWLMSLALDLINDGETTKMIDPLLKEMAVNVMENGVNKNGGVYNESESGKIDKTYIWWVQGESVVGFYNAYNRWGIKKGRDLSENCFHFIKNYIIDPRKNGEWFWDLDKDTLPKSKKDIVEPWKCPYHNGRMCFEMIRRLQNDT